MEVRVVGERVTFTHASVFYRICLLRFLERPDGPLEGEERENKHLSIL